MLTNNIIDMKRLGLVAFALLLLPMMSSAQKFAYVDTKYILLHMPDYAEAQSELNRLSAQWQSDIENKLENVDRLVEAYEAEQVLLTADMKKKRQEEIDQRRQEARDLQKSRFGVGGELFTQRESLIKPVQDKIYEGIKEVASSKGYMVIFDKNNQSNMLYTNPKHDVSDQVLREMGLTPGELIEQPGDKGGDEKGGKDGGKSGTKSGSKDGGTTPASGTKGSRVPAGGAKK